MPENGLLTTGEQNEKILHIFDFQLAFHRRLL